MNNEEAKKVKALLVLIANAVLDLANALCAEEPVEPAKEEPKAEEPKVAEPVPEEPMPIDEENKEDNDEPVFAPEMKFEQVEIIPAEDDEPKEEPVEPAKEEPKAEEPKVAEPVPEEPMPIEQPKEEPKPVEKNEQELISSFDQFGNVVFVPRIKH